MLSVAVMAIIPGVDGASPRPRKDGTAQRTDKPIGTRQPVKVLQIVSGDTVLVMWKGQRLPVRLRGVTAPGKEDPRSEKAVKLLRGLLGSETTELGFGLPPEVKRDDRGRLLAYLFAGGESVNERMIDAGWSSTGNGAEPSQPKAPAQSERDRPRRRPEPPVTTSTGQPKSAKSVGTGAPSSARVCITRRDKTYHRARCQLVRNARKVAILKSEAIRQGYKRCTRCKP